MDDFEHFCARLRRKYDWKGSLRPGEARLRQRQAATRVNSAPLIDATHLMLATLARVPFSRGGWLVELKYKLAPLSHRLSEARLARSSEKSIALENRRVLRLHDALPSG
ncbi:hypothetical protein [Caballeronia arationis]|jgi:hypothetical protein|uniref:hypothetical protein n=1 Tax=Caballeronia arationis TaxID=1777142 RepID=UPI00117E705A|nr:hypothetical protein [Caballeronia arationis]